MIFVTGGAGFIGSNFVLDWLADPAAEPVVNLDALTYAGNRANLASLEGDARHHLVHGDIGDRALVDALLAEHRPRAIVNFAAQSEVAPSWKHPEHWFETNVVALSKFIKALKDRDYFERYVHLTSPVLTSKACRKPPPLLHFDGSPPI